MDDKKNSKLQKQMNFGEDLVSAIDQIGNQYIEK